MSTTITEYYKKIAKDVIKWTSQPEKTSKEADKFLSQLRSVDASERAKTNLVSVLENQSKLLKEQELKREFLTFVLLAAFKTAETIIHRLADNPGRKLNRRFKYAWTQLKHNPDGTVSHNFVHNVGNVPQEYISKIEVEAKKFMKIKIEHMDRNSAESPGNPTQIQIGRPLMITEAPYFTADETNLKNASVEDMVISDMQRNDTNISDIYIPDKPDMSPCGVHDGTKLRSDCVICKEILPEEDRPVIISKAFIKKLNVTENLLKFLAIQQDKRAAANASAANAAAAK